MAGSLGEATLDLNAELSGLSGDMEEAKRVVQDGLESASGPAGEAGANTANSFVNTALGVLGSEGVQMLGDAAGDVFTSIFDEAFEAEKVQAQLNAVLLSTGEAAGWSADEANALAESLSTVTKFSDDSILSAETMLLTFTNIGEDVFPGATEAVLNLASKFGSTEQASVQLGKALNDPINGVGALQRVGVTFTEDQKALIESLVATGDVAGAQQVILDELAKEFGGLARAEGETAAGQMAIAQNQVNNILEDLGTSVLPVLVEILQAVTPLLKGMVDFFGGLPEPVKVGIVAFLGLLAALVPLFTVISGVITLVSTIGPLIAGIGPVIAAIGGVLMGPVGIILLIIAVVGLLFAAWQNNWFGIRDIAAQVWGAITSGLAAFGEGLKILWSALTTWISTGWTNFWTGVGNTATSWWASITGGLAAWGSGLQALWDGMIAFLTTAWNNFWTTVLGIAQGIVDGILGVFNIDWAGVGNSIVQGIIDGINALAGSLMQTAMDLASSALGAIQDALGIRSPSSVFRSEVGHNIVFGIEQGVMEQMAGLRSSLNSSFSNLASPLALAPIGAAATSTTSSFAPTVIVNNPTPERASDSVSRALRNLAYLGVG